MSGSWSRAVVGVVVGVMVAGMLVVWGGVAAASFDVETTLTAADAAADDRFGYSVAVSGVTAVVGVPGDEAGRGAAYVFVRSGTSTWSQQAKLTAGDGAAGDEFGSSVAVSGVTVVVGAPGDDDGGSNAGSAYVFVRSGTAWSQQKKLTAADAAAGDEFGSSVGMSGVTVVVGAPDDDDAGERAGSAYVFVRSGTSTWLQQAKLTAADAAADDRFGYSVGISGVTAVVGARYDDDAGENAGSAYVFVRSGTSTWSEQAKLTADTAALGEFGFSVGISGVTVVVGAPFDEGGGSAYVFVRSGTSTWSQQAKLTAADAAAGNQFGRSVAVSGVTVVVGASGGTGSASVFVRSGTAWSEQAKLTAADAAAGAEFGSSVGISGVTAVVGAPLDGETGSASVFGTSDDGSTTTSSTTTSSTTSTTVAGGSVDSDGDGFPDDVDNFPEVFSACGDGQATVLGTGGAEVLVGTGGDDVIMGLGGGDTIKGRGGDDVICAGDGDDRVLGGGGRDTLLGEGGADDRRGGGKGDSVRGGEGDDVIRGGGGGDSLDGEAGVDAVFGGGGADFCLAETVTGCEAP